MNSHQVLQELRRNSSWSSVDGASSSGSSQNHLQELIGFVTRAKRFLIVTWVLRRNVTCRGTIGAGANRTARLTDRVLIRLSISHQRRQNCWHETCDRCGISAWISVVPTRRWYSKYRVLRTLSNSTRITDTSSEKPPTSYEHQPILPSDGWCAPTDL